MTTRAGEGNPVLPDGGAIFLEGIGRAKCAGVVNGLMRYLTRMRTLLWSFIGTIVLLHDPTWLIRDWVKSNPEDNSRTLASFCRIFGPIELLLACERGAGKRIMRNIIKWAHKSWERSWRAKTRLWFGPGSSSKVSVALWEKKKKSCSNATARTRRLRVWNAYGRFGRMRSCASRLTRWLLFSLQAPSGGKITPKGPLV